MKSLEFFSQGNHHWNIIYDQDWKKKLHDFMRVFDCPALSLQK